MRPVLKQIQNNESMALEHAREVSMPAAALFGCVTFIMLLFGLTMLYSTSFGTAGSAFFVKQLLWAFVGGVGLFGVMFFGFKKVSDRDLPSASDCGFLFSGGQRSTSVDQGAGDREHPAVGIFKSDSDAVPGKISFRAYPVY